MDYGDLIFSPQPSEWKWYKPWTWFELRNRWAIRVKGDPHYGDYVASQLKTLEVEPGVWKFFTFDIAGLVHGYHGFRPINVYGTSRLPGGDPKFYWRDYARVRHYKGNLYVEWAPLRLGVGKWG